MKLIVLVFTVGCMASLSLASTDAIAPKYGVRPPTTPSNPPENGGSDIDKCGCHEIVAKLKKSKSDQLTLIRNLRNKYGSVNSNLVDMKKHVKSVSWYVNQTLDTSENINTQVLNSSIVIANIMQMIRGLTIDQQRLVTKAFLTESILALEKRHEESKPQPPEGEIVYTSCDDERIIQTGTYLVQDAFYEPAKVLCVLDFGPGAYTVIQNRQDGSTDFYRGYSDYRSGFGDFDGGDYWLGLDRIHNMTTSGDYELFIVLEDFERNVTTARYDNFEIGTGNDFYPITRLDGYSGSAGDSYGAVVGVLFSAYDLDLDESTSNCAVSNRGAWWYTDCGPSNLNGLYLKGLSGSTTGMFWETFRGAYYSLKKSRMMVRRKQMSTTTESPSTTTPTTTMVTETTVTTTDMGTDSTSTTTEMSTQTAVTDPSETTSTSTTIFTTTSPSNASSSTTTQTVPSSTTDSGSSSSSTMVSQTTPTVTTMMPMIVYTSCDDERITQTGRYLVQDAFSEPAKVLCVLDFGPGAYTAIQNRQDGTIDFYLGYSDYRSGFGDFDGGDYWLGLDRIHNMTTSGDYELFIVLEDFEGNVTTARYDSFEIGTGNDFYPITKLNGYSGTAGDSYGAVVGVLFSAQDLDLDNSASNCAISNRGAWWYTDCGQSNLNGLYLKGMSGSTAGMFWETFRGANYSLKTSRMMVKRK